MTLPSNMTQIDRVTVNHQSNYQGQRSLSSKSEHTHIPYQLLSLDMIKVVQCLQ